MPQPNLPPTPLSSTELLAKDLGRSTLDNAFELPPPALGDGLEAAAERSAATSPESTHTSPDQKVRLRRTSTARAVQKHAVDLPPPPSRSRKIIQMKPKAVQQRPASPLATSGNHTTKTKLEPAAVAGTKRKAAGGTAAGRKIARKTAHSLIERRRRSKMNEEFATLKDMVPACRGHEMHKLAILQASIDYLRYLQNCITDLKDAAIDRGDNRSPVELQTSPTFSPISSTAMSTPYLSPNLEPQQSTSQRSTPRVTPQGNDPETSVSQRTSPWPSRSESFTGTDLRQVNSQTNLPAEDADLDDDQNEATAALLMLNRDRRELGKSAKHSSYSQNSGTAQSMQQDDRSNVKPRNSITGISVRELLS